MTHPRIVRTRGVTLVELIVVLAIVATTLAVTSLSLSRTRSASERDATLATIARLRSDAIRSHTLLRADVRVADKTYSVLALPDGSIRADSALAIDQLTGRANETRP
jgi:prepilin-type N-terminal cleavage/methylation domain-containing protein